MSRVFSISRPGLSASVVFIVAVQLLAGCGSPSSDGEDGREHDKVQGKDVLIDGGCRTWNGTEQLVIGDVGVTMKSPESQPAGDLLLLSAWDESENAWCTRTRICTKALKKGYRIVIPQMGKSLYCREVYPETRSDWQSEPTYAFLQDTLLKHLQDKFCLFTPEGNNLLIGVGAGARGAVRLLQEQPDLFDAAAAMSGDYNPALSPRDNLYRGFFGDFESFQGRWEETENLCAGVSLIRTPLYLAHGIEDNYVSSAQTEQLYNHLQANNKDLEVQYNLVPEWGHGFAFWSTQINDIFRFFETTTTAHAEAP